MASGKPRSARVGRLSEGFYPESKNKTRYQPPCTTGNEDIDAELSGFRAVRISRLAPAKKHHLFKQMQAKQPALVDILKNDPVITDLKRLFGAEVVMDERDYKKLIEE